MIQQLLIANRGEIAVRILRTAAEMRIRTVAVACADDQTALHARQADSVKTLPLNGSAAYLDAQQIVSIATASGCDAIHPGYGFLSESAAFAQACTDAGITFVGPTPAQLECLGDKAAARALAQQCKVPVLTGSAGAVTLEQARELVATLQQPVMLKALMGGGGRGMRLVSSLDTLDAAYERCRSEALRSFGDDRVYVEQALPRARHIEVQVLGDGTGRVMHLGERDCTLQRRHQKLIEIAPSPGISVALRSQLLTAATTMASAVKLANAATFEFLVDAAAFYFLEANPRLQVEHTITEELWQVDLVRAQLQLASGAKLAELQLEHRTPRPGFALQARINTERLLADGTPVAAAGTLSVFEPASGPGVRVDTHGYRGYTTHAGFDSLLAKLIVTTPGDWADVIAKAERALGQFDVQGVATNIASLRALLTHPQVRANDISTRFVDEHLHELLADEPTNTPVAGDAGIVASPITGTIVSIDVAPNESVAAGQSIAVVEAMKMEYVVVAHAAGTVSAVFATCGMSVKAEQPLVAIVVSGEQNTTSNVERDMDFDTIRPDLARVLERQRHTLDEQRTQAVERRHAKGGRTARENVAALCDPGTFVEYGALVVAAQRARRSLDELIRKTPADGAVVGFGAVNGTQFDAAVTQTLVIVFDETVLAGTMGEMAREKMKHCLAVAHQAHHPVILFAEGGGGRAGDTDGRFSVTGWTMDVSTYFQFGRLSGLVPLVGVTSGRCFAANAGVLACCDVIIATANANIGVGGPSMIEGGRLGQFTPEEIGPMSVQAANGVVDIVVPDELEAAAVAKQYLAYFQGSLSHWDAADQRALRAAVPENRLRAYDVRNVISSIADADSVLELRRGFGSGMITALARVEGRSIGIVANNPLHLSGAIDADGADKASRFMRLCEAFGLPLLMLCDTPGVMVGPEAEKAATVRKMGRMFVTGANLTVPFFTMVLRKAYGIGAELMTGGWFKAPRFVVSWPTGEFGGMNIEGNVKLAYGAELAAIIDPQARQTRFDELVQQLHENGSALSAATQFEIDNVIDPADSRTWIASAIRSWRNPVPLGTKRVPFVDPW